MLIDSINIEAFKGIKNELMLDLSRSITVIYSQNGVGKTTIYDAVCWLLSGKITRTKDLHAGFARCRYSEQNPSVQMNYNSSKILRRELTKSGKSKLKVNAQIESEELDTNPFDISNAERLQWIYTNKFLAETQLVPKIDNINSLNNEMSDVVCDCLGFKEFDYKRNILSEISEKMPQIVLLEYNIKNLTDLYNKNITFLNRLNKTIGEQKDILLNMLKELSHCLNISIDMDKINDSIGLKTTYKRMFSQLIEEGRSANKKKLVNKSNFINDIVRKYPGVFIYNLLDNGKNKSDNDMEMFITCINNTLDDNVKLTAHIDSIEKEIKVIKEELAYFSKILFFKKDIDSDIINLEFMKKKYFEEKINNLRPDIMSIYERLQSTSIFGYKVEDIFYKIWEDLSYINCLSQTQSIAFQLSVLLANARNKHGSYFLDQPIVLFDGLNKIAFIDILRLLVVENNFKDLRFIITTSSRTTVRHFREKFSLINDHEGNSVIKLYTLKGNPSIGVEAVERDKYIMGM